jgi:predicted transcriptional regulator with HTH domain
MRSNLRLRQQWRKLAVQRAVMALTLAAYPHWQTLAELSREIERGKAVKGAIDALIEIGLLETHGTSVRPTPPAAHLDRLRLP